jgi:hypothetical protein
MIREQADECLADGAGRPEHRDGQFLRAEGRRSRGHDFSSARTMRSYASTDARSSSRSMNSSGVCAT